MPRPTGRPWSSESGGSDEDVPVQHSGDAQALPCPEPTRRKRELNATTGIAEAEALRPVAANGLGRQRFTSIAFAKPGRDVGRRQRGPGCVVQRLERLASGTPMRAVGFLDALSTRRRRFRGPIPSGARAATDRGDGACHAEQQAERMCPRVVAAHGAFPYAGRGPVHPRRCPGPRTRPKKKAALSCDLSGGAVGDRTPDL